VSLHRQGRRDRFVSLKKPDQLLEPVGLVQLFQDLNGDSFPAPFDGVVVLWHEYIDSVSFNGAAFIGSNGRSVAGHINL